MDTVVIEALREAGIDLRVEENPLQVCLRADGEGNLLPIPEEVLVGDNDHSVPVRLKQTSELFAGDRRPPDLSGEPPQPYLGFIQMIELGAAQYCAFTHETIRDKEFETIYNELRRRPDGPWQHPISEQIQLAIRLYMSLRDVSEAEYEGVLRRLTRSARTFAMGYTSMNYVESALLPLVGAAP